MTTLVETVQDILRTRLPVIALPEIPKMDEAYREAKQKLGEGSPITLPTTQESEYWVNLAKKIALQESWNDLKPREIKNIVLCLWYGDSPLAGDEHFLKSFLKVCEARIKKSLCRALIWVYLYNYELNRPGIVLLGQWLTKTVGHYDWLWADRHRELSLFGGHQASRAIADTVMSGHENVSTVLESYGLGGTLQSGGMASAAFLEALKSYSEKAKSNHAEKIVLRLNRILEWARLDGRSFSYPKLKTLFIESLLLPWINVTPDDKIVNTTQSFLLDCFGDPRFGGASWKGVDENAMRVIRGWLVKRALAQFLDVVDELALDHQWIYRRAFWMAYYNKGVISDAWVAFAANGAYKAQQIARRNKDNSWLSFGTLRGAGDTNHAILILRIGDLIIADFSHNGKCRIWTAGNRDAPKPYEPHYNRSDLVNYSSNYEFIHSGSPNYLWQGHVASAIHNVTGIIMMARDFIPR